MSYTQTFAPSSAAISSAIRASAPHDAAGLSPRAARCPWCPSTGTPSCTAYSSSSAPIPRVQMRTGGTRGTRDRLVSGAWRVARSVLPAGSGRGRRPWSSGIVALDNRQLPPARSHILLQRAGLIPGRGDPEVPVVRRTPLGDDRQDLDELIPTGEATRCLVAPSARVAVDSNGEDVGAHRSQRVLRVIPVASLGYWPSRADRPHRDMEGVSVPQSVPTPPAPGWRACRADRSPAVARSPGTSSPAGS